MNVSVESLLQPQASYSRTGKMTEAFTPSKIHVGSMQRSRSVDYSKTLSANELGHQEPDSAILCSSPRLHPSVMMKAEYVSRQEREVAFRQSMQTVLHSSSDGADDAASGTAKRQGNKPLFTEADWRAAQAALRDASKRKLPKPSSSFLAVPRGTEAAKGIPPVGHYRPKFEVVEESPPRVKITKRSSSPRSGHHQRVQRMPSTTTAIDCAASLRDSVSSPLPMTRDDMSPTSSQAPVRLPGSPGLTQAGSLTQDVTRGNASAVVAVRAPTPSWPFASGSPGHVLQVNRSWSVEPDPTRRVNASVIERGRNGSKAFLNLRQMTGRKDSATVVQLKDVFYNTNSNPFSGPSPTYRFQLATGRDRAVGLPRTSNDVPRASASSAYEFDLTATKYQRQAVLVDFGKALKQQPSRKAPPELPPENATPVDALEDRLSRVRSPDFSKYTTRSRQQATAIHDVTYDVSFAGVDKHAPVAAIHEPCVQPRNTSPRDSQLDLNPDDKPLHPKVGWSLSFESYVSRDGRSRCGRGGDASVVYDAQQQFYDVSSAKTNAQPSIHGDVVMAHQVSREQRVDARSPPRTQSDRVYDVEIDSFLPSLRRGMVDIEKMVDREHRAHSSLR